MQQLALQLRPTCVLVQLASSAGVLLLLLAIMAFLVPERLASAPTAETQRSLWADSPEENQRQLDTLNLQPAVPGNEKGILQ